VLTHVSGTVTKVTIHWLMPSFSQRIWKKRQQKLNEKCTAEMSGWQETNHVNGTRAAHGKIDNAQKKERIH